MRASLVRRALDVPALLAEISDDNNGATAVFVGTVRATNDGRDVTGIDYSAYDAMAEHEMQAILSEASSMFGSPRIVAEHRLGTLAVGEASIAIVAAHERRGAAMDAMRYVIEEIKRRVPIWKREHYSDGTRIWVDPTRSEAA